MNPFIETLLLVFAITFACLLVPGAIWVGAPLLAAMALYKACRFGAALKGFNAPD